MTAIAKPRPTVLTDREKAEQAMQKYAEIHSAKVDLEAKRKERIDAADAEFGAEIKKLAEQLEPLEAELNGFAEKHPEEFKGKKSLELLSGTIGWRLGTGKLEVPEDVDKPAFEKLIRKMLPDAVTTQISSPKVVSGCKLIGKLPVELEKLGIKVVQNDSFYVKPRLLT